MPPREWILSCGIHDRYTELHRFAHADLEGSLVRIEAPPGWMLRENTSDRDIFTAVVTQDEYGLRETTFSPEDVVLDVGAHTGSFALMAFDRGCRRILCFEAHRGNHEILVDNLGSISRDGLASGAAWYAIVGTETAREMKSLLLRAPHGTFQTGSRTLLGLRDGDGEVVPLHSLDAAIEHALAGFRSDRIRLLKLDCEGSEWDILEDSRRLNVVQEIVGEYHENYAPEGRDRVWLVRRLKDLGYDAIRVNEPRHGGWGFFGAKREK